LAVVDIHFAFEHERSTTIDHRFGPEKYIVEDESLSFVFSPFENQLN
jgi:hypothetical protein